MNITQPGIYRGVSSADYFADPCPTPSLTQSICKILIERSPQHAWVAHPRLNPQFEYDDDTKFDIGNVAHRLILGRGKEIEVVQFADWRKKEAQDARKTAADQGKIAVLKHQFELAVDMAVEARCKLDHHEDRDAFTAGDAEVMVAWEEDGIWCRSLVDWLHRDLRTVDDYKSSGMSMAPHVIGIRAQAAGWEVQAAFIERGLDIIDPAGAGRRRYRFIGQEADKPHALTVMHMNEYWMTMGRKKVAAGLSLWKSSLDRFGTRPWPAYTTRSVVPEYPGFKEKQWLDREESGEFEPDTKLIMAG